MPSEPTVKIAVKQYHPQKSNFTKWCSKIWPMEADVKFLLPDGFGPLEKLGPLDGRLKKSIKLKEKLIKLLEENIGPASGPETSNSAPQPQRPNSDPGSNPQDQNHSYIEEMKNHLTQLKALLIRESGKKKRETSLYGDPRQTTVAECARLEGEIKTFEKQMDKARE